MHSHRMLFTAPAVWQHAHETRMFAADDGGTAAWTVRNGRLAQMWTNSTTCTSPVVAGGLLYVYNPNGSLNVYDPLRGMRVANLNNGPGHWNSSIVVDGKIALPEGNANQHTTTAGVLEIWTLPAAR